MTSWKRHSKAEISGKLTEAGELAAMGKTQSEIGRAIGISVMTYHRWRKRRAGRDPIAREIIPRALDRGGWLSSIQVNRVAELQLENLMLRRLVRDLLLENAKLEEAASQGRSSPRISQRSLAQGA
jgi:hypothetical protein